MICQCHFALSCIPANRIQFGDLSGHSPLYIMYTRHIPIYIPLNQWECQDPNIWEIRSYLIFLAINQWEFQDPKMEVR